MSRHEQFEELCAQAAIGELSGEELQELNMHLKDCPACRTVFEEIRQIHSDWLPERSCFEIERTPASELGLRRLILERVGKEGAQFSHAAQSLAAPVVLPASRISRYLRPALATAAALFVAVGGLGLILRSMQRHNGTGQRPVASVEAPSVPVPVAGPVRGDTENRDDRATQLEASLTKSGAEISSLELRLNHAEQRAKELEESNSAANLEVTALEQQLAAVRASQSQAQEELTKLKSSQSERDAEFTLVRTENQQLREKLNVQKVSVDRERELMADGREIRDLIAARNLHIIDVYDTSGKGQTQKSFGRVFYTEGKSLVFYAYDLPSSRPQTKYAFYAWGKRDGSGEGKARNLGIFYNDDQTQKRWVLKITDPQTLSEIDSVFVTLEKTDGFGNTPTGKKLLSAYLGSPANHP
jgi:Putative zinc-finger